MVYHIGVCATVSNIPDFLTEKQGLIEKLEKNESENLRIETVTLFRVAQQHLLFWMPLPVLVYLTSHHLHLETCHTLVMGQTNTPKRNMNITCC